VKINQDLRAMLEKREITNKTTSPTSKSFHDFVQKQDNKLQLEQLNRLMTDIEVAGNRMTKNRSIQELSKYNSLVKRFIHEAIDFGMNLKQSQSFDYYGNRRTLKLIEQIDGRLIELTDGLVNQEKNSIDLLASIDEIKGLLINLYT
jgi:uncharacterized protein